jgi:hypothetical protein
MARGIRFRRANIKQNPKMKTLKAHNRITAFVLSAVMVFSLGALAWADVCTSQQQSTCNYTAEPSYISQCGGCPSCTTCIAYVDATHLSYYYVFCAVDCNGEYPNGPCVNQPGVELVQPYYVTYTGTCVGSTCQDITFTHTDAGAVGYIKWNTCE